MGYAAMAVGVRDLAAGVDFLKQQSEKNNLSLLSANLLKDGKLQFKPWLILNRNGLRIGVTAITATDIPKSIVKEGFTVEEPSKALKKALQNLEGKSDIIILLSNAGYGADVDLCKNFNNIDIIIGSGIGGTIINPLEINNVFLMRNTPKGKSIGVAKLMVKPENKGEDTAIKLSGRLVTLDKRFAKDEKTALVEARFEHDYGKEAKKSLKKIFGKGKPVTLNSEEGEKKSSPNPFLQAIKRAKEKQNAGNSTALIPVESK